MNLSPDALTIVEIEGLYPSAIFCDPVTAHVLRAALAGEQITVVVKEHPPWISDIRRVLLSLVEHSHPQSVE